MAEKVYYNFNWNPFCHICADVMYITVDTGDRDEHVLFKRIAHCEHKGCVQQGKRFVIPPLSAEVEEVDG